MLCGIQLTHNTLLTFLKPSTRAGCSGLREWLSMDKVKIKEALPIVFGQTFLFVFLQKFLFGINAYEPLGVSVYDYYGFFLVALALFTLGYSLFTARDKARIPSKAIVLTAGALALPASICLLFDIPNLLSPIAAFWVMIACLIVLCAAFCLVLFAWLNRLKQESLSAGVGNVLISVLVAAFIYSVITPSDVNETLYMIILEVISLPLAAVCYLIPPKKQITKYRRIKPMSKKGVGYLVSASLFLFVMLLISYVDVLNEGYPDAHYEHPTFYALLLISIAIIIAVLYRGGENEPVFNGLTQNLIQIMGAFFLLTYIFVFFFAASSYDFCFQFTCFVRRLIAIVFFVVVLSLTFIYDFKIQISMGIAFLVPYFLAKALMMFSYLPITTGVIINISDFRLIVLLVLGILLIVSVGYSWYFHKLNNDAPSLLQQNDETIFQSFTDAARYAAIVALSEKHALSEREKETLYYLSMGYSVNRVAELLFITNNTAGTHIRSIYKKMKLHNKQDIIDVVNRAMGLNHSTEGAI